ncbi:MAG: threonylcarbamoyl-AMP synthase [Burkholderiales bacterium]|nr:MAG: threonylcarbamoyl-AMP synthase [Burkholderiales bacterium]
MAELSVSEGARLIAAGELLAFPTETVYGLGADASSDSAVAKIFAAKGRPADHPLIVHVSDRQAALHFAAEIPDFAQRLIDAFWPGPLTIIVPRKAGVAAASAGGQDSIGLRCPSHPLARELLAECAKLGVHGISAPSANKFGKVSPTTAAHVKAEFGDAVPVLDGGACDVGIESTIIDCTRGKPVLLRPGVLTPSQLEAAMGLPLTDPVRAELAEAPAPRASGTLESHYAPAAPLRLMDAKALQTALDLLGSDGKNIAIYARSPLQPKSHQIILRRMPADALATAQQLFAVLREFDGHQVKLIWVETVPADVAWDGVRDRLQRAAA